MKNLINIIKPDSGREHGAIPILLAPMAGITDSSFRRICIEQGCDFTFTEMVSAKGLQYNNKKTMELISISPAERPCGVQLFGHDPELLADTCERLLEIHGGDIGVIDINMGCPAPKITGNGDGSALMKDPVLAGKIIETCAKRVPLPVSVKFRKGWDDGRVNAVEFAKMAEQSGAAFITIHGRTRMQMYSGTADWDVIAEAVRAVSIPVVGNGDVFSGEAAVKLMQHTCCAGIMAARGAQGNPFIFAEIRAALNGVAYTPPTREKRLDIAIRHIKDYMAEKNEGAFVELRKHAAWYTKGMYGSTELRRRINNASCSTELSDMLERFKLRPEDP